jgi:predicted nucleic acid-binding protein
VAYYVDTSALVKLVVAETETEALRTWIGRERGDLVACDLTRAELMRAVRHSAPERVGQARAVLDSITLIDLTSETFEAAGRLDPAVLRTLDAIHLVVALELGDDLDGLVAYDERLADAARGHGITVLAPA